MAVTRALSPAQQRALVLVAIFFVASAYLCATRLVNASFGHEAPARQSAAGANPAAGAGAGAAEVRLEPADLPMSYGQYGRPGLNGMGRLVAALPADRVPSAANARRLLVVGDVHGMDAALARLLDRVAFDAARDHVVAVGDLVAKGPESPAVVARLMRLNASAVRGNHEDRVLLSRAEAAAARGLRARLASPDAELHRGQAAHLAVARSLSQPQLDWLAGLPLVLDARPLPLYVVHAGLVPGLTLDRQDPWAVMNMRSLVYPREELRSEEKAAGKKQDLRRHQDPPPPRPLPPTTTTTTPSTRAPSTQTAPLPSPSSTATASPGPTPGTATRSALPSPPAAPSSTAMTPRGATSRASTPWASTRAAPPAVP